MKKLVSLLFLVFVMVIVSACGKEEADKKKAEPAKSEQEEKGVEVEKGLRNVEVTLPASLIGEKDIDELVKEAKAKGVKEVTKNEDGSITYKMSKQEHEKMMQEMEKSVQKYIEETKNDENVSSIKDITHNKSFTEFTLSVDQEKYEKSFDRVAALGLGMSGLYYQVFSGESAEEAKVTISLKNADTGEVFDTIVYPDDLPAADKKS